MLKNNPCSKLCLVMAFLGLFILSSCVTQKAAYFSDISDTLSVTTILPADFQEPMIQADDILSITIQTIDPQSAVAVNQAAPAITSSSGQAGTTGFLVDKDGNVEIPMLGKMKLAGFTTNVARERIRLEASKYFKNPTVQVRFANYKITVIGEVVKPATYTVPNEKVTILDAIGMAGDLTIYGMRENVMLIRDNGGKKDISRIDLTSSKLFQSPYFYLKQNDVIYVEPGKGKVAATNAGTRQTIATVVSILSLIVVLVTRL